jgi:hypothetical protein
MNSTCFYYVCCFHYLMINFYAIYHVCDITLLDMHSLTSYDIKTSYMNNKFNILKHLSSLHSKNKHHNMQKQNIRT